MRARASIAAAALLAGCAAAPQALPPCERWSASLVEEDGQPAALVLNMRQVMQLHGVIRALAEGKCRLPKPGEGTS